MSDAWAKFSSAFWEGFESARAEARARAQSAPLDANHPFAALTIPQAKAAISAAMRAAYDSGMASERARIAEILQLPCASKFQELVVDLALGGDATPEQVAMVISRTEVHVQARLHPTESSPLDRASADVPTLH
jgi:hypothetical protein